jgi:hypothetical protein
VEHSAEGTSETPVSTLIFESAPSSSDGYTVGKGKKGRGGDTEEESKTEKGSNLVGKITNLVSTDLNNIVDGRDFPRSSSRSRSRLLCASCSYTRFLDGMPWSLSTPHQDGYPKRRTSKKRR